MMDRLTIDAAEAAVHANFPRTPTAALIVELDGPRAKCDELFAMRRERLPRDAAPETRHAADAAERDGSGRARKAAFAAMGRVSPNYYVQDGVVPRTRLPEVLRRIASSSDARASASATCSTPATATCIR